MFITSIMPVNDSLGIAIKDADGDDGAIPLVCWGVVMHAETMHDSVVGFVYVAGEPELLPVTELDQHGLEFIGYGRMATHGVNSD